jgi:hypothetical protein
MRLSGHRTRSVFDRYNIVSGDDLVEANEKLEAFSRESGEGKQGREVTKVVCFCPGSGTERILGSIPSCQMSASPFGYAAKDSESILTRLVSEKCVSINLEKPGLLFSSRFPEGVMRLTDLNVYAPGFYQHYSPAFARKATGDSSSPKVDIAHSALRHRLTIGNIAEL